MKFLFWCSGSLVSHTLHRCCTQPARVEIIYNCHRELVCLEGGGIARKPNAPPGGVFRGKINQGSHGGPTVGQRACLVGWQGGGGGPLWRGLA
jgi:hypothetical protein